jgi:excisionase family DNA binding protein
MEPMESLLTTEDLANYLKVDVVTVRRLVSRGELAAYRIGGEYRFTRSDIVDYLHRQHIPARPPRSVDQDTLIKQASGKLTRRAKQAIWKFAVEEARAFKQPKIGTEHILLGLILEGDGVAGRVLSDLGVTVPQARAAVEATIGAGTFDEGQDPALGDAAKDALEYAVEEAKQMSHHFIGTEHTLLGILREHEGNAVRVLEHMDIAVEQVRLRVVEVIQRMPK